MNSKKKKVLKFTINEMMAHGIESLNIDMIAQLMNLDRKILDSCFIYGDNELLMDTVEYAGKIWIENVKKEINFEKDIDNKLKLLVRRFALGSIEFPASLSAYIDLWKIVKDKKDEYIKVRLRVIYQLYIDEFHKIVNDIGEFGIAQSELNSFSFLMTILSDVIHIQSITLENNVDYEALINILDHWTAAFFCRNKNKTVTEI